MQNYDKTFIRGPSPNYSDDIDGDENSSNDNILSTLPVITNTNHNNNNKFSEKSCSASSTTPAHNQSQTNSMISTNEKKVKFSGFTTNDHQQQHHHHHNCAAANAVQPQVRGRNTFAFWTIVICLLILSIGNLILITSIIGVLHLGKGMEYLELIPEENAIKFFGLTDLDRIYKKDGIIEGFADVPITITGENSDARINVYKANGHIRNKMLMTKNGTTFDGINQFDVNDPITSEPIFSTHKPHYNIPKGVDNLYVKQMSTSCITAPIYESLTLNNTRGKLMFRGTEGVEIDAKEINLSADQNVYLKSINGSITFGTTLGGVYVDMRSIPVVGEYGSKIEQEQYKLCVCMPQGKLYRVPVPPRSHNMKGICNHFNSKSDPCI